MKYRIERTADGFYFPELGLSADCAAAFADPDVSLEQAASAALAMAMNALRRRRQQIPMPDGTGGAEIPFVLQMKIALWNWMQSKNLRGADLGRAMGINGQQVARIMNFAYPSDVKTVVAACEALGASVSVTVSDK